MLYDKIDSLSKAEAEIKNLNTILMELKYDYDRLKRKFTELNDKLERERYAIKKRIT